MPAGSAQSWTFTFTIPLPGSSPPYPITGSTWAYIARTSPTDLTSPPLIEIGGSYTPQGLITVTDTASTSAVLLAVYPAATVNLTPGTYYHTLWQNPGDQDGFAWFTGSLIIQGNPQP
jgi:hypothetical protein